MPPSRPNAQVNVRTNLGASNDQATSCVLQKIDRAIASKESPAKPGLMTNTPSLNRAYALARTGACRSVSEIIRRLPKEDVAAVEAHLLIPGARRDLILVCSAAWLAAR